MQFVTAHAIICYFYMQIIEFTVEILNNTTKQIGVRTKSALTADKRGRERQTEAEAANPWRLGSFGARHSLCA